MRDARTSGASDPSAVAVEKDITRLFNLSLDLLCIAGLDGYFRRVNPSWTRVLGWSEAELLSRPVHDFMHPDDRQRTLEARAGLARGVPVQGLENRYLCKDGSYRWLSWQSVAEPGDEMVIAVARDITERRQLEHEQLVLAKLESTGILAGGIAHDFNNLLTSLGLNLEMVALCGPLGAEQAEHLRRGREILHAAKEITDRLVSFSGGGVSLPQTVPLESVLRPAVASALLGSSLTAEVEVASDLPHVNVDVDQIAQVFRHLVLNAREASPVDERIRVEGDAIVLPEGPTQPSRRWVRVRVQDHGSGIAAEVLPKVFDPYFSTKQRGSQKGMGLGLTISRMVARRHGGSLTIETQPQRGTTVTLLLPAAKE